MSNGDIISGIVHQVIIRKHRAHSKHQVKGISPASSKVAFLTSAQHR